MDRLQLQDPERNYDYLEGLSPQEIENFARKYIGALEAAQNPWQEKMTLPYLFVLSLECCYKKLSPPTQNRLKETVVAVQQEYGPISRLLGARPEEKRALCALHHEFLR